MTATIRYNRTRLALPFLLAILIGCSSSREIGEHPRLLTEAVSRFVSGDDEGAEKILREIVGNLAGEEKASACLYLGRICLRSGRYEEALQWFHAGRAAGEEVLFNLYMEKALCYARISRGALATREKINRAELAAMLDIYALPRRIPQRPASVPEDVENHWARESIERVLAWGLMRELPDGRFHAEAAVTEASFLLVAARLTKLKTGQGFDAGFPAGLERALSMRAGVVLEGGEFVGGRDAMNMIRSIASLRSDRDE